MSPETQLPLSKDLEPLARNIAAPDLAQAGDELRAPQPRYTESKYGVMQVTRPGPELNLFGRREILGFDSWGNQAPNVEINPK